VTENNSKNHTANRNPRHQKQNPNKKGEDHETQATKGQPEQAEASKLYIAVPNIPPKRKQPRRSTQESKRPNSQSSGDQTKSENETKRIKAYECTCPVCGQTHEYKSGQDRYGAGGPKQM